jgi:hypothetical protein
MTGALALLALGCGVDIEASVDAPGVNRADDADKKNADALLLEGEYDDPATIRKYTALRELKDDERLAKQVWMTKNAGKAVFDSIRIFEARVGAIPYIVTDGREDEAVYRNVYRTDGEFVASASAGDDDISIDGDIWANLKQTIADNVAKNFKTIAPSDFLKQAGSDLLESSNNRGGKLVYQNVTVGKAKYQVIRSGAAVQAFNGTGLLISGRKNENGVYTWRPTVDYQGSMSDSDTVKGLVKVTVVANDDKGTVLRGPYTLRVDDDYNFSFDRAGIGGFHIKIEVVDGIKADNFPLETVHILANEPVDTIQTLYDFEDNKDPKVKQGVNLYNHQQVLKLKAFYKKRAAEAAKKRAAAKKAADAAHRPRAMHKL